MKTLQLHSETYTVLLERFQKWMTALNYANTTIQSVPNHVKEYLHYVEQRNIFQIRHINSRITREFILHIQSRANERKAGGLSTASINKIIVSLSIFFKYLRVLDAHSGDFRFSKLREEQNEPVILTPQEIKKLFQATYVNHGKSHVAIGTRDRAMLAIFYGCGLRKSEGLNLNIQDINLNKRLIYVLGKGNKERFVPISTNSVKYIEAYIHSGREWFLMTHTSKYAKSVQKTNADTEAFFLNEKGKRLQQGIYMRLNTLTKRADIQKKIGVHTLRHSIATHLLVAGMDIEDIAKFLGHASLESTQVYTHIAHNYENVEDLITT